MHDTKFPEVLQSLLEMPFEYLDGEGIEFEPYRQFLTSEEGTEWLRAWTGNDSANADRFRVFGQDGTGGLAAFWLVKDDVQLVRQPVVFFGSEGELGVVASSFGDYLWLLAEGIGPYEAVSYGAELAKENVVFRDFALEHAPHHKKSALDVLKEAKRDYPGFEEMVRSMCSQ